MGVPGLLAMLDIWCLRMPHGDTLEASRRVPSILTPRTVPLKHRPGLLWNSGHDSLSWMAWLVGEEF